MAHCQRRDWGSGVLGPSSSPAFKLAMIFFFFQTSYDFTQDHIDPLGLSLSDNMRAWGWVASESLWFHVNWETISVLMGAPDCEGRTFPVQGDFLCAHSDLPCSGSDLGEEMTNVKCQWWELWNKEQFINSPKRVGRGCREAMLHTG